METKKKKQLLPQKKTSILIGADFSLIRLDWSTIRPHLLRSEVASTSFQNFSLNYNGVCFLFFFLIQWKQIKYKWKRQEFGTKTLNKITKKKSTSVVHLTTVLNNSQCFKVEEFC